MNNLKSYENFFSEEVNEDNIGLAPTRQDQFIFRPGQEILLDGSLFKLGIDKIDKNSDQFKKAIDLLKSLGDANVDIEGGASAVGNSTGYDNNALAARRAANFIKAAREEGVTANMNTKTHVGVAEVPNSPAANAEQYVKIIFRSPSRYQTIIAIDNATALKKPIIKAQDLPKPSPITDTKNYDFKIVKVIYKKGDRDKVLNSIYADAKSNGANAVDVTKDYVNKGYKL